MGKKIKEVFLADLFCKKCERKYFGQKKKGKFHFLLKERERNGCWDIRVGRFKVFQGKLTLAL